MAQVPNTDDKYVGDGVDKIYDLTFPYLEADEVFTSVDDVVVPHTLIAPSTVELAAAPAVGAQVRVFRSTVGETVLHVFDNGVPFLPRYVDENNRQLLYIAQETANESQAALEVAEGIEAIANEALAAANDAVDKVNDVQSNTARFLAPSATDPLTRDDGSALQIGDQYFNTTDNTVYLWNGADWYAPNVDSAALQSQINVLQQFDANLGNTTTTTLGSAMVGWTRMPLQDAIAAATTVGGALSGGAVSLHEFAHLVTVKPNPSDYTTWNWTPAVQAWLDYCALYNLPGLVPAGKFSINQVVVPTGNLDLIGSGYNVTTWAPFSAGQTLFYKDQTPIAGVDNVTNARVTFRHMAFADEAGLGGCRAVYGQRVLGWSFENVLFRKLSVAMEFNRSQNLNLLNIMWYKGGQFKFDATPYRKYATTYDYCRNININGVIDLLGYSDLGGSAWFYMRDCVNVLMQNVQSPAMMGLGKGLEIRGASEGIELLNVIFVWPTDGIVCEGDLIDTGTGLNVTVRPQYLTFTSVHVDQPKGHAWVMDAEYWNCISCLGVNGNAQPGGNGKGMWIKSTSKYWSIDRMLLRDMGQDGLFIESGAAPGRVTGCDVYNNAILSGHNATVNLARPNDVYAAGNNIPTDCLVTGGYWVGGNSSSVIYRQVGSAATPATSAETDLFSYTIPAGTMKEGAAGIGGHKLTIRAHGTFGANATTKTVRLYYGGASIGGLVTTQNGQGWKAQAIIDLNQAGQAEYERTGFVAAGNPAFARGLVGVSGVGAVTVKVTGQNDATTPSANDIVCEHFSVELTP